MREILLSPSACFLASYALLLCLLAQIRPLWLDELLQLSDTYGHTQKETVDRVAHNPGGVPVAYVAENLVVNRFGYPLVTARVFPVVCAIAGMAGMMLLIAQLGVSAGWLYPCLLFAAFPLCLRYAVEARQYGPALAFSICSTATVVSLDRRPALWKALLYTTLLSLGVYTQPYVGFSGAVHCVWAPKRIRDRGWLGATYTIGGAAAAFLLFLPWYLYARNLWVQAVEAGGYQSSFSARTILMILREISGGGYLLTAALLALAVFGYRRTAMPVSSKYLLFAWAVIPIPLAVGANAVFHYFFAIRQIIFILPPLCILAAEGLHALPRRTLWAQAVPGALGLLMLSYDVRWFTGSRENWGLAASSAKTLLSPGSCLFVSPSSAEPLYFLYEPSLRTQVCAPGDSRQPSLVLISPYITTRERALLDHSLGSRKLVAVRQFEVGGSVLIAVSAQR